MKRIILFSASCLLATMLAASFAPADCPQQYWGTKTLYTCTAHHLADAPRGYKPIFINYVCRHGARHATNLRDALLLVQLLSKAAREDALTDKGDTLRKMMAVYLAVEKKEHCGLLTEEGEEELYGIGKRMAASNPGIFKNKDARYIVSTTKEQRTMQSAVCFMKGLGHPLTPQDNTIALHDNDSIHLRFFELSTGYRRFVKKGPWMMQMEKIRNSARAKQMNNEILCRFFKTEFAHDLLKEKMENATASNTAEKYKTEKITDALFSIVSGTNALQKEIIATGFKPGDLDVSSLLTCDELAWLEFVNSAKEFLLKGPGTDANGIQVRDAAPLLADFIFSTDSCIASGTEGADLRFAHAETMAPFAALLQIDGAATATRNIFDYYKHWKASNVMLFGANVQWIIYKSNDGRKDVLVKILYNESPVHIPVHTDMFPYYKWKDVNSFYMKKLSQLHIQSDKDLYPYLLSAK